MKHPINHFERLQIEKKKNEKKAKAKASGVRRAIKERLKEQETEDELQRIAADQKFHDL